MDFEQQLKDLPDLYYYNGEIETELPETIKEFWLQFNNINTRNKTVDSNGVTVCAPCRCRSFSELYQITKSKYDISFSEFIDQFIVSDVFGSYNKAVCACKDVMKVTFYSSSFSNYEYVYKDLRLALTGRDYHKLDYPYEDHFSDLEKYIYDLIEQKAKQQNELRKTV